MVRSAEANQGWEAVAMAAGMLARVAVVVVAAVAVAAGTRAVETLASVAVLEEAQEAGEIIPRGAQNKLCRGLRQVSE